MKKCLITSAIAVFLIMVLITCKKDVEIVGDNSNKLEIGPTNKDSVSYFSASVKTTITDIGSNTISQHGHCWSTVKAPGINDNKTILGTLSSAQTVASELQDLENNTKYYLRPYFITENSTIYGAEIDFTTLKTGIPLVSSSEIINIEVDNVFVSASIIADSGLSITNRGFCWDTIQNFSISSCIDTIQIGTGIGDIESQISNLSEGKTYYLAAFASNAKGTSYGEINEFSTKPITLPVVYTESISNITINSSNCSGRVAEDGNGNVSERGICWNTSENPTLENNLGFINVGSGLGSFTTELTNLNDGTVYYVRAYATNDEGTSYGDVLNFSTLDLSLPIVSTLNISNITINSSLCAGSVTDDGNGLVTDKGICWGNTENPTLENNLGFTNEGSGLGSFTSELANLNDGTLYYVKAYAKNQKGTAYGDALSFTTLVLSIPTVHTSPVTNITQNSAISGGNIIDDGNSTVVGLGVCWNTTGNPTLENNDGFTIDTLGWNDIFVSYISGLSENTYYYVCSYAINVKGTAYGQVEIFAAQDPPCGQFTVEYAGKVYNTVLIVNQCWLKENLNIGTRIDDSQEMIDNSVIEKYCPAAKDNCDTYGGLYQWDEMMQYVLEEGAQGICPDGWHIPTDLEWTVLMNFLGGADLAGGKKKETGYEHWAEPNTGATNSSGFTALPGGRRDDSGAAEAGLNAYFWSSSSTDGTHAEYRRISYSMAQEFQADIGKSLGASVRCIKD